MGDEAVLYLDCGGCYLNLDRSENLIQLSSRILIYTYMGMYVRWDDYMDL